MNEQESMPGIVSARKAVVAMARKVVRSGITRHPSGLLIRDARLNRARPFRYAWSGRVLMGYLNLQVGEEGIGKSTLVAWQAAKLTQGALPGDLSGTPRRVLFVGDEDAWDHVWVPRLHVAGADLDLVNHVAAGPSGRLNVSKDADVVKRYIESEKPALVYFDQLLDNLGYTDSWKDKQVRDTLTPIAHVAQETDCALLASMHPNKRGGSFRDQISGTPAFNALSRSSLFVVAHPEVPGRAVVVRPKGNYNAEPFGFEFQIEQRTVDLDNPRRTIVTNRITMEHESALRTADVIDARKDRRDPDSKAGQARKALNELFVNGEVRPAKEVLAHLFEVHGLEEREVQRARADLKLESWKEAAFQGQWFWGYQRPKIKLSEKPAPYLDGMDRGELKGLIRDSALDVKVFKGDSDDEIRAKIRAAIQ